MVQCNYRPFNGGVGAGVEGLVLRCPGVPGKRLEPEGNEVGQGRGTRFRGSGGGQVRERG